MDKIAPDATEHPARHPNPIIQNESEVRGVTPGVTPPHGTKVYSIGSELTP